MFGGYKLTIVENQSIDVSGVISKELKLGQKSVQQVIQLLEEGNTVPFIARYRKEMTGSLDEVCLYIKFSFILKIC